MNNNLKLANNPLNESAPKANIANNTIKVKDVLDST